MFKNEHKEEKNTGAWIFYFLDLWIILYGKKGMFDTLFVSLRISLLIN